MDLLGDRPFRMPDSWYDPPEPPPLAECPDCEGTGKDSDDSDEDCVTCAGTGDVEADPTDYEPDPDDARDRRIEQQYEDRMEATGL